MRLYERQGPHFNLLHPVFPGLLIKEAVWQLCHELDDYSFMGLLLSPSFHSVDHKSVSVSLEWSLCRTAGGVNPTE